VIRALRDGVKSINLKKQKSYFLGGFYENEDEN